MSDSGLLEAFIAPCFQGSCRILGFTLRCYCTIFTLYPHHLSEAGKHYYSCLVNGREERQTEEHLLKLTLLRCPAFTKSIAYRSEEVCLVEDCP